MCVKTDLQFCLWFLVVICFNLTWRLSCCSICSLSLSFFVCLSCTLAVVYFSCSFVAVLMPHFILVIFADVLLVCLFVLLRRFFYFLLSFLSSDLSVTLTRPALSCIVLLVVVVRLVAQASVFFFSFFFFKNDGVRSPFFFFLSFLGDPSVDTSWNCNRNFAI